MNTIYKKIFAIVLIISSSAINGKKERNLNPEDNHICLQFAPIIPTPFSQDKDDQYFVGLIRKLVKVDQESRNNPRVKKNASLSDFIADDKQDTHLIYSKNRSFGWNDPLAIISAMFFNNTAETPNELIATIEESVEFSGKYKAKISGKGLYSDKKSAHGELTNYVKNGPVQTIKYEKLENITTLSRLYDEQTHSFKKSEKEKLRKYTPSIQGEVTCNCYFHGCDLNGVIYFDKKVIAYLLQEHNGNRHLSNTVSRDDRMKPALEKIKKPEVIIEEEEEENSDTDLDDTELDDTEK